MEKEYKKISHSLIKTNLILLPIIAIPYIIFGINFIDKDNFLLILLSIILYYAFNNYGVKCRLYLLKNNKLEFNGVNKTINLANFFNYVILCVIKNCKIILWSILFIIPGIYKIFEYYYVPYIAAESYELTIEDTFAKSYSLTKGRKKKFLY